MNEGEKATLLFLIRTVEHDELVRTLARAEANGWPTGELKSEMARRGLFSPSPLNRRSGASE